MEAAATIRLEQNDATERERCATARAETKPPRLFGSQRRVASFHTNIVAQRSPTNRRSPHQRTIGA